MEQQQPSWENRCGGKGVNFKKAMESVEGLFKELILSMYLPFIQHTLGILEYTCTYLINIGCDKMMCQFLKTAPTSYHIGTCMKNENSVWNIVSCVLKKWNLYFVENFIIPSSYILRISLLLWTFLFYTFLFSCLTCS